MRILVAYDGSACAAAALADLVRAGLPSDCRAMVLTVADVWLPEAGALYARPAEQRATGLPPIRQLALDAMEVARHHAAAGREQLMSLFPGWDVWAEASAESPAWSIIKRAEEFGADLVVVGSHGRGAIGRVLLGSVSIRILDELRNNVRIARDGRPPNPDGLRILVATDGSADAMAAVEALRRRNWLATTQVRVVTAANWRLEVELPFPAAGNVPLEDWAQQLATRAADSLANSGFSIETVVRPGDAKRVILAEAQEWNADCIFMGARGLSRTERWLLGSVSTAVATRAPCSVEVVHLQHEIPAG